MTYRVFWADTLADEVIERYGKDGEVVVKCAASPSGGKHIGNINDILRGFGGYDHLAGGAGDDAGEVEFRARYRAAIWPSSSISRTWRR